MAYEVINIGPGESRKRRVMGFAALLASAGLAFTLVAYGAPRWTRAAVFFPVWIAALGLLQARERTCIALAARGVCNMDAGDAVVEDESLARGLREKARRINRRALLVAAMVTLVALAFPQV
jgi:anti-sigma factor RsiW